LPSYANVSKLVCKEDETCSFTDESYEDNNNNIHTLYCNLSNEPLELLVWPFNFQETTLNDDVIQKYLREYVDKIIKNMTEEQYNNLKRMKNCILYY
jgi:hypothetical protein